MKLVALIAITVLKLVGILIFCAGFFPSKTVLQGYSSLDNDQFTPQFDKVVVMVVDALRSDFIFSTNSEMKYVHELINLGKARGFTAFSNPPTVTLPRLKGLTTGSTPNFLDAVLNVIEGDESSTLVNQDSWLKQLQLQGKKIHMFGDDTWLKLFPGMFEEVDGTSSFFVSDFTEVDNNVTRHLDHQLTNQDWDCLILHYLGLDHIGHKGGPNSVFMKPKQQEMDQVIEKIHQNLEKDTLFVVLGDHGMNEIGNHGGSSAGETSAGLLFISDKFTGLEKQQAPLQWNSDYLYYDKIQQIDLVPTLSTLLHLPIPKNSLGVFIKDFLDLWSSKERKVIIDGNVEHLKNFKEFEITDDEDEDSIYAKLLEVQSELTKSATNYNLDYLHIGLLVLGIAALLSIVLTVFKFGKHSLVFIGGVVAYSVCAFGSSLVEEEHQIWWWFTTLFITLTCFDQKFSFALLMIAVRLIRGWNTQGQKYVGDTVSAYLGDHLLINWGVAVLTVTIYASNLNNGGLNLFNSGVSFGVSFMLSIILITFKLLFSLANGDGIPKIAIRFVAYTLDALGTDNAQDSLVPLARMFYFVLIAGLVIRVGIKFYGFNMWFFNDLHNLLAFLIIFQTPINNIGIFLALAIIKFQVGLISRTYNFNKLDKIGYITFSIIALQNLTFFAQGQTNSLNTVDLANSYNGVTSYNIFATGLLTFISNFAGPLYWAFASLPIIFETKESLKIVKYEVLQARCIISLLFFTISSLCVLFSCYLQRYHLFIWTVFSPKLLFIIVWNFFISFGVELIIAALVAIY